MFNYLGKLNFITKIPQKDRNEKLNGCCKIKETLPKVEKYLKSKGMEKFKFIIAIDYTSSNFYSGEESFDGNSLHDISDDLSKPNYYEITLSTIGKILIPFNIDEKISLYGFGDEITTNITVFKLSDEINSIDEAIKIYKTKTLNVKFGGPSSYAPIIYKSIDISKKNDKIFNLLLIISDGRLNNIDQTVDAIKIASKHRIIILVVALGDGPWNCLNLIKKKIGLESNFYFFPLETFLLKPTKSEIISFLKENLIHIPETMIKYNLKEKNLKDKDIIEHHNQDNSFDNESSTYNSKDTAEKSESPFNEESY